MIPVHFWQSARLKFTAPLRNERIAAGSAHADYLGLENIEPWTGRIIQLESKPDEATDGDAGLANVFREGDVLFGKLRPYLAKACHAPRSGVCSTELLVMRPAEPLHSKFLLYSLLTPYFVGAVDASTFGAKMPRASWDFIGSLEIRFPPIETQSLIANYLDRETARIDGLIAEKERMLALLEEKRAALVSRVGTRGLDPNASLKPSGQEWLGDIPAHWELCRIKFVATALDQGSSPIAANTPASPNELGVLKLSAVSKGRFKREENKALREADEQEEAFALRAGDVLVTRSNTPELVADVACVPVDEPTLLLPDLIYRLRVQDGKVLPEYLTYFLATAAARAQIRRDARGSSGSMVKVSQGHVLSWLTLLPPLSEQAEIVGHLQRAEERFRSISRDVSSSLSLLSERRAALITPPSPARSR
ncbi:MAG: hypothetical protein V2I26_17885 [Halieaceae bacterium]|nr:hypothetical protein [Halieaceae bacterium]